MSLTVATHLAAFGAGAAFYAIVREPLSRARWRRAYHRAKAPSRQEGPGPHIPWYDR